MTNLKNDILNLEIVMKQTLKYISDSLKKNSTFWLLLTLTLVMLALPTPAQAQTSEWTKKCVAGADGDVATIQGLECLIANVFSVILTLIGIAGFIMMFIGAFQWLVTAGSSKGVESARNTITYAVVGLVVALSAFIILNLIASFTGISTITRFIIPNSDRGL